MNNFVFVISFVFLFLCLVSGEKHEKLEKLEEISQKNEILESENFPKVIKEQSKNQRDYTDYYKNIDQVGDLLVINRYKLRKNYELPAEHIKITEHVYKIDNTDKRTNRSISTVVFITTLDRGDKDQDMDIKNEKEFDSSDISPPFCCTYIEGDARWYSPIVFKIDPSNSLGISESYVMETTTNMVNEYETLATGFQLYQSYEFTTLPSFLDPNTPDGLNTETFGIINIDGVIGVTITHISTDGATEIFEADVIINELFNIGDATLDSSKYDYESVKKHEGLHFIGIGHVPTVSQCSGSTMYPTLGSGETNKRSLTLDDQLCVTALYDDNTVQQVNSASHLEINGVLKFLTIAL